jgi:hypothetical protein
MSAAATRGEEGQLSDQNSKLLEITINDIVVSRYAQSKVAKRVARCR